MSDPLSFFQKFLYEAPGDDPPDAPPDAPPDVATATGAPPDMGDVAPMDDGPPDMDTGGGDMDAAPPDMDGGSFGDEGDFGDPGDGGGGEGEQDPNAIMGLDDKVSTIMNQILYQRFLALLNNIGSQLQMIKSNSDILYTLSTDSIDIISDLKKLDENVRLYLKNTFLHENYSKNLLFFNKCLNLLKLLNDSFDANIRKGIKSM